MGDSVIDASVAPDEDDSIAHLSRDDVGGEGLCVESNRIIGGLNGGKCCE